ncbi:MAG TPA: multiheme c-type cytochrome [Candidatus Angelobacter sp.]
MAHAATPALAADILRRQNSLVFQSGSYKFAIATAADGSAYSVSDGANSLTQPLDWAFGNGEMGQTYVFHRNGNFYESRVSFYPTLQGLDLTLGHQAPLANDLAGALGRLLPAPEVRLCFGCHTTASTTNGRFDAASLFPGVTCEACHGPGARHVHAMQRKQMKLGLQTILNPARLNPVDAVDFCGACHRTGWDVMLANTTGVANVRFQPYRLEKSRCWGKGDGRLTCMACHDPHVPLVRDSVSYDDQCLSCHITMPQEEVSADHPGKACPVGTSKCVTCHMAKYEIPGSHAKFTDHWIRVINAKPDSSYPD